MSKTRYSNLFRDSGAFTTAERGTFRALIVGGEGRGSGRRARNGLCGGVIGPDLVVEEGELGTRPEERGAVEEELAELSRGEPIPHEELKREFGIG